MGRWNFRVSGAFAFLMFATLIVGEQLKINDVAEKQAGSLDNFGLWYELVSIVKKGSVNCVQKLYISEPKRNPQAPFHPPSIFFSDMYGEMIRKKGLEPFVCIAGEMGPMLFLPSSTSLYFGSVERTCSVKLSQIHMEFTKEAGVFKLLINFYEGSYVSLHGQSMLKFPTR